MFALLPRERAAIAGGDRQPAWQPGVLDAVRDQLGRVVKVVAARLVGRAVKGQVPIRMRIRNQRGSEILSGISRVYSDTACILLRLQRKHERKYEKNCLSHKKT